MGKASRRKRSPYGSVDAAALAAARTGYREPDLLDTLFARWDVALAVAAWVFWLVGHLPDAGASFAVPLWLILGFATGVVSPWLGLVLGVMTIPFLGGAVDGPSQEVLRNVSIHGAALRVLADRFVIGPAIGKEIRKGPPTWVVICAALAVPLYMLTVSTGAAAVGGDQAFFQSGIRWVIGGSAGMMSAWIAGSHLVWGREKTFTNLVFVVLSVALLMALLAYAGVPGITIFTFPGVVNGRLAALGYPTPTGMGIAVSLPFAVAGAFRFAGWVRSRAFGNGTSVVAALPYAIPFVLIGVALYVIGLTASRGPMLAVAAGVAVALLGGMRVPRRFLIPGAIIGIAGFLFFLQIRFRTFDVISIITSALSGNTSDFDRVMTWGAAIQIAIGNPIVGGGWRAIERFSDFATRQVAYSHNTILHGFAEGGFPLGIVNGAAILYSVWMVISRRKTMAPWLIVAAVTFFVCGAWDIPQVRTFASTMGGIAMGMAAGPLIARGGREDAEPAAA